MTPRHGLSSTLRLLSRLPQSASSHSRPISSTTKPLKQENQENQAPSDIAQPPQELSPHDYRAPSHAAQPNFPGHIRHLMRSTPHPLTVITSRSHPHHSPTALLVSSFNTVTLTPSPHVSFNIKLPSRTYTAIQTSHEFAASGLKDAAVADAFVKKRRFAISGDSHGGEGEGGSDIWQGWVGRDGRLKGGKGGTWWMRCRVVGDKCVEVGDHVVVVAKVVECGGYEGGDGIGLVYADGGYRKVGEMEDMRDEKGNT